jgi:glycerol-3-phosphate acyltransferase PlsX
VKKGFAKNLFTKLVALLILPILKNIGKKIDPNRYNGASLIGLNGIVIKSHGSTSVVGFVNAIEEGICEVEKNVPERIRHQVSLLLKGRQDV